MRASERALARRELEKELRYFRLAARQKNPAPAFLRAIRNAIGIPIAEIARELKVNRSVLFRLEESEERGTISLKALERVAAAMGFKLVYAIVPQGKETLEEMSEWRGWEKKLGNRE
jgi:transcriptional regulator with XRE-family HTH domain